MENKYGFIEPFVTRDNYILGGLSSVPKDILQPNGQWDNFLPERELQNLGFETANCTGFGTTSCIEILMKKKYNI